MVYLHQFFFLFFIVSLSHTYASAEIPTMEAIIQAQKHCSSNEWKTLTLESQNEFSRFVVLNPKEVLFANDFIFQELPGDVKVRKFKISFNSWGGLSCDLVTADTTIPDKPLRIEGIYELRTNPPKANFVLKDLTHYDSAYKASEIYRKGSDDNSDGFVCIIDPKEFIKKPDLIDLQKLCKSSSLEEKKLAEILAKKYLEKFKINL